jgi:outer membrane lipopolysaccharide assembly protein LptE/RlpB
MQTISSAGKLLLLLLALLGTTACGYRFSGTGLVVPEGARTLSVLTFMNGTNEPYVDVEVTRAVVNEFLADGRLRIADREEADLVLRGKVTAYEVTPLSYTADAYVQQYRVYLKVDASLEDGKTGKVLWQERNIVSDLISSYPVTIGHIRETKMDKDAAVKKASQDIAWEIRSRILEGF